MPDTILRVEDVPEPYLRLINVLEALGDLRVAVGAVENEVATVMETAFAVPVFPTEAENVALYDRAHALQTASER